MMFIIIGKVNTETCEVIADKQSSSVNLSVTHLWI